jgi:hypothetical protein
MFGHVRDTPRSQKITNVSIRPNVMLIPLSRIPRLLICAFYLEDHRASPSKIQKKHAKKHAITPENYCASDWSDHHTIEECISVVILTLYVQILLRCISHDPTVQNTCLQVHVRAHMRGVCLISTTAKVRILLTWAFLPICSPTRHAHVNPKPFLFKVPHTSHALIQYAYCISLFYTRTLHHHAFCRCHFPSLRCYCCCRCRCC